MVQYLQYVRLTVLHGTISTIFKVDCSPGAISIIFKVDCTPGIISAIFKVDCTPGTKSTKSLCKKRNQDKLPIIRIYRLVEILNKNIQN